MTDFEPNLVSTVIPVHNRARLLGEAVASVLAQTHRPLEIIVVNDGSTDETAAACDELARRHPGLVHVVHQANGGPGAAREAGRLRVRGEFVQYLDSDDCLRPRKFECQVAALRSQPQAGIAYCGTAECVIGGPTSDTTTRRTGERLAALFPALLSGRVWQTPTPLFRRALTDLIGPWRALTNEEDWEYDARAAALGTRLAWCPEVLADFRHHGGPRAGGGALRDPRKMASRAEAHRLIYQHAVRAGVALDDPNMQRFARELFLLARQCGLARLSAEARMLFELAVMASGPTRGARLDFRCYRLLARCLGWSNVGRWACWLDEYRPRRAAPQLVT